MGEKVLRVNSTENAEMDKMRYMIRFLAGHLDGKPVDPDENLPGHLGPYSAEEWERFAVRMYNCDVERKLEIERAPLRATILAAVLSERARQIDRWGHAHDNTHTNGELACAASFYALPDERNYGEAVEVYPKEFGDVPLDKKQGKPRLHQICVAMALLLAEAERLAAGIDRYAEQMPKIRPEFQDELVAKLDALVRSANKE